GIEVTVSGTVVDTRMPLVYFVPMRVTNRTSTTAPAPPTPLEPATDRLREDSMAYIPDSWPLRPGGFLGWKAPLVDARAKVDGALDGWLNWAEKKAGLTNNAAITRDILLASLSDAAGLGAELGQVGRTVIV